MEVILIIYFRNIIKLTNKKNHNYGDSWEIFY